MHDQVDGPPPPAAAALAAGGLPLARERPSRRAQLDARGHLRPGTPSSSVERPLSSGVVRPRTGDTMSGAPLRLPARSNRPQAQQ